MEENRNMGIQNTAEVNMEIIETEKPGFSRKKKVLLIAMLVCCAALFATGTLAYFTAEEKAYNVITTGELSMELVEETTGGEPWPEEGVDNIVPGMEVDKIAYVKNVGSVDFYVRMGVEVKVIGEDGEELPDEVVWLDYNVEEWTEQDGYFYCNSEVKPGEETEPLFTVVGFDTDMGNAYMNARVEVNVTAQAIQSRHNGDSALEAEWLGFED